MTGFATLPMYDWPEVEKQTNALWTTIRTASGIDLPRQLDRQRPTSIETWLEKDLILSQTCGYPFSTALAGKVRYLGTPHYDVAGCQGPYYSSAIIINTNNHARALADIELDKATIATNSTDSLSGYRAAKAMLGEPESMMGDITWTGSHRASCLAVARNEADIAFIDAVAWHLFRQFEKQATSQLRVIGWGPRYPGLPMITSTAAKPDQTIALTQALKTVLSASESGATFPTLRLCGFSQIEENAYFELAQI